MKAYEVMIIYKSDQAEEGAKKASEEVKGVITTLKGEVTDDTWWGKRKFAYEIKHATEGFYEVINFNLAPEKQDNLKKKFNLNPSIVRYLITIPAAKAKAEVKVKPKAEKEKE